MVYAPVVFFGAWCKTTGDERKRGCRGPPLPGCKGCPLVFPSFPKRWGGYTLISATCCLSSLLCFLLYYPLYATGAALIAPVSTIISRNCLASIVSYRRSARAIRFRVSRCSVSRLTARL